MNNILKDKIYLPKRDSDFYKTGVFPIQNQFESFRECEELLELVENEQNEYTKISNDINDYSESWKHVPVINNYNIVSNLCNNKKCIFLVDKILNSFPSKIKTLTFYKAKKGLLLHRHRDMSGNLLFGKLRIHIPIKTTPNCFYLISKNNTNYLFHAWRKGCFVLDTGYIHGVKNNSKHDRIHLMIELHVNKSIRKMLPKKNIDWYLHMLNFIFFLVPYAMFKRYYSKNN